MTDTSRTDPEEDGLRADAGDANRDRRDLQDQPPTQVDGDEVARHIREAAGDTE